MAMCWVFCYVSSSTGEPCALASLEIFLEYKTLCETLLQSHPQHVAVGWCTWAPWGWSWFLHCGRENPAAACCSCATGRTERLQRKAHGAFQRTVVTCSRQMMLAVHFLVSEVLWRWDVYQKWVPCFELTQSCVPQPINLSSDSSALGCSKEGKGAKSQEELQMLLIFSLLLAITHLEFSSSFSS